MTVNSSLFKGSWASNNRIGNVVLVRVNLDHSGFNAPVEHETPELSGTIGNEAEVDVAIGERQNSRRFHPTEPSFIITRRKSVGTGGNFEKIIGAVHFFVVTALDLELVEGDFDDFASFKLADIYRPLAVLVWLVSRPVALLVAHERTGKCAIATIGNINFTVVIL